MFITIINDCHCQNAAARQTTRVSSLFGITPNFLGVNSDIEAAGNLIDILDVAQNEEGYILVNVAPRGEYKKWENGTPFGYFKYKNVTVFTSISGYTLSLIKKLKLAESIELFDIPTVIADLYSKGIATQEQVDFISNTQFRSLEFLPRAAFWIYKGYDLPTTTYSLSEIDDLKPTIWWIDNFGNCKTTILPSELESFRPEFISKIAELPFHTRLTDVVKGAASLTQGSSGIGDHRFVEIVVQRGRANEHFEFKTGADLTVKTELK
jgi:S-adenosyl-l-methionine hydroxide adenosyltransferase